ncbi:MAG: phosphoribosylformylglycinamidine synthase subunit PurS [Helicobacteraceae bacterium]|jgi:phosphoribosylformylglycinamidine synthase|nr:phosphoribosylformylglycinamidine synthase subunit PurS [Helicobacteraceae bacterium]
MKVVVNVYLKDGILDPQGKAVTRALGALGFDNVSDARIGKRIVLDLALNDSKEARQEAEKMASELLVNEVIEEFSIEVL